MDSNPLPDLHLCKTVHDFSLSFVSPVVGVVEDNSMVIPGDGLIPRDSLQVPLHAVCAHPVHIIGFAFVLQNQAAKDIQHGAILADAVACSYIAPVVHQDCTAIILSDALRIVCLAPVLHVTAHLHQRVYCTNVSVWLSVRDHSLTRCGHSYSVAARRHSLEHRWTCKCLAVAMTLCVCSSA